MGSICHGQGAPGLPGEGRLAHVVVMVVDNHGSRGVLMAAVRPQGKYFSIAIHRGRRNVMCHK